MVCLLSRVVRGCCKSSSSSVLPSVYSLDNTIFHQHSSDRTSSQNVCPVKYLHVSYRWQRMCPVSTYILGLLVFAFPFQEVYHITVSIGGKWLVKGGEIIISYDD